MLIWNSSLFCLELHLQLSQLTRPPRPWRRAATSAYRSRSQTSSGSRRSSRAWAWRRGWCWWASAAGCTVDTAGGSSWDTTPRPSRTRQQVSRTSFDVAVLSGVLSIMAGVQRINCEISRIKLNFRNVTFFSDSSPFFYVRQITPDDMTLRHLQMHSVQHIHYIYKCSWKRKSSSCCTANHQIWFSISGSDKVPDRAQRLQEW